MFSLPHISSVKFAAALFLFAFSLAAQAQSAASGWGKLLGADDGRSIDYAATVPLLGKATPVTVKFYCNPKSSKESRGALGFDILIQGVEALRPFHFDDFEGPDAVANGKRQVRATVLRKGKPAQVYRLSQSGWYATMTPPTFGFGVSAQSRLAQSAPRSLLKALGEEAESLQIVITDTRDAKLQLAFSIPLDGRQVDFQGLLGGLK